jgi:hypothetical protein
MKNMCSSIEENNQMKEYLNASDEQRYDWYIKEINDREKVIKQFEQDNVLFINKKSWSLIMKEENINWSSLF